MYREPGTTALLLLLGCVLAPAPAAGQAGAITAGQTITGRLEASDPRIGDGSHYDEYRYNARAGERLNITLRSRDFNAFLYWGEIIGSRFEIIATDDNAAGGTDARIEVTVEKAGSYVIRANSMNAGETGAYSLVVTSRGGAVGTNPGPVTSSERADGPPFVLYGAPVTGQLAAGDPVVDGARFHVYRFYGAAGDRLVVSLASSDFDTYLSMGAYGADYDRHDDDGGNGTDSRLAVTIPAAGVYALRVKAYDAAGLGRYTLRVDRAAAEPPAPTAPPRPTAPPPATPTPSPAADVPAQCRRFVGLDWTPGNMRPLDRADLTQWARCAHRELGYTMVLDTMVRVATYELNGDERWTTIDVYLPAGEYTVMTFADRNVRGIRLALEGPGEDPEAVTAAFNHWQLIGPWNLRGGRYRVWMRVDGGVYTTNPYNLLFLRRR